MVIEQRKINTIVSNYDPKNITIGIFGSHSALPLGISAKTMGFNTVIIVQKGRHNLYVDDHSYLYDSYIVVDKFKDILDERFQEELRIKNTIFFPNRSFAVYVGCDKIENKFMVPIYGNRTILKAEERTYDRGQYFLLDKAGIRFPKEFIVPEEIDRPVIVKVQRADNPIERANFYATSANDFYDEVKIRKAKGLISDETLAKARIEEFVLGSRVNANFHKYALMDLFGDLDLVGLSDRRQVNLQGFLNLPAKEQIKLDVPVTHEEIGHYGITIRESKQPLLWDAARKLCKTVNQEYAPGIIGLFGLQGAIAYSPVDNKTLEFVVFDLSFRIPGDPAIGPTSPEMRILSYKHKRKIKAPLDLSMIEINEAAKCNRLEEIVT